MGITNVPSFLKIIALIAKNEKLKILDIIYFFFDIDNTVIITEYG